MTVEIELDEEERNFLDEFVKKGTKKAREIARANILLLADQDYPVEDISEIVRVHRQTVWKIKKRYLEEGLESALKDKPRPGQPKKWTEEDKAEIIATACTSPPEGRKRWTIRLLRDELQKKSGFEDINRETIRLILKKTGLNLG
ncbi:transposase [candidate division MSBL1 archaeon SCGC-AAA382A13]|uniref:Transposase n=2 Tax=candidate division MSBL1 TaxID=215777 RepID=A0A133VDL8_9EURY|nr:transposase [candidate division MSBL1 archaeon SCGC-AAA382A03]KXB05459.1 transposase [candidate division MSBL1 archaeon SCGC-AAA382A13]